MRDLLDFEALKLTVASPEMIREWSFGEVTKPETINYRTLKAEKDGLFSENIFGPTKDYECYCGKYKRIRYRGVICDKCGVEVTQSKVRRERMGHITLASPVAHSWFVKGAPSKLSLLLDISPKNLEAVVYFASYLVIDVEGEKKTQVLEKLEKDLQTKIEEAKKNSDVFIKQLETGVKEELGKAKVGQRLAKERFELLREEMELKNRQEIQKMRDNLVVEQGQLENIYQAVASLVKTVVPLKLLSEDEYFKLEEYGAADFATLSMGAEALLESLKKLDLDKLSGSLREEVRRSTGQKHIKATKRLRIVEGMRQAGLHPEWMILRILPVLPPDLRPMVQLPGGRFATSDLNDLYRRVINRNNRLNRLINLGAPEIILRNEKRMLQEAVDALIDASARSSRRGVMGGHTLRSLSDMLRGKQGRFRQNLLGKRVDYSGRSVIVVGPKLKLNQVGLPKEMALEMFKPFVLREMISRGLSSNVKGAKNVLETRPGEVWDILEEIIKGHPILINRAPTLHRLGIQAFYPILVDGNAIQIHPCICAGFNADFDGDQMAVHVPLSTLAQEEAKELMMAKENIFGPASGQPITVPNREMALGCYFMTTIPEENPENIPAFTDEAETIMAYQTGKISLRQKVKVRIGSEILDTSVGRVLFNQALPAQMRFMNVPVRGLGIRDIILKAMEKYPKEEVIELIDRIKDLGFWSVTLAGISIGIFDAKVVEDKPAYLKRAEDEVAEIESNLAKGLITPAEKSQLSQMVWIKTTEELANSTWEHLGVFNPIRMMVEAGARGSRDQAKQLSAMRGLTTDPTGKIVELPTKSNYREGLAIFEYFTSCRGARKGVADRALKTADAGYLTRRLVDVAHDVIIRMDDCGTKEGLEVILPQDSLGGAISRLLGRKTLTKIVNPKTKQIIVVEETNLSEDQIAEIVKAGITNLEVRSPLTCETKYGLCSACYGYDLTTRKPVKMGIPVGVISAQAIGEPGTQLTMRTFHTGGIVGLDITQGLPRVEELFEARIPKVISPIAEIAGKVSITETESGIQVRVRTTQKPHEEREYLVPATATLTVEDGQLIAAGTALATGHLDTKEVLRVKGLREAQKYLINEVRLVYESQGVPIHDKHFEVIVRKMSDKVRIESQGDTNLLPGEIVDKVRFEDENNRVLAGGGEPATAEVVILGITRASLQTESFLSAASFQETTTVLADAAIQGKQDKLLGLKENVIIGRLIPTDPERARVGR
ncbi:MAG: DNA-directed RNA polymerase subunit beta' [Candidatus Daviesbacteria bacterium]|nr:DNA-directed RNA polymerase subunit beta' [Candidatus Daviesbacteria bacterium]